MLFCDRFEDFFDSRAVLNTNIGLLTTVLIFLISPTDVYSKCLTYYLYGYNQKFVHFPLSKAYCVQNDDGRINIKTDKYGGRIIVSRNNKNEEMIFFGESQLFGFDISGNPGSHDLNKIFPEKKLIFYGAPNNGPIETIEYIKFVLSHKPANDIIIGFNFGTDVFRLLPKWNPKKFVPLNSKDLAFYLSNPFLYELKLTWDFLGGSFFTAKRPDNIQLRKFYKKINKEEWKLRINEFFNQVSKLANEFNVDVGLVIYSPYWGYEKTESANNVKNKEVMSEFREFVCVYLDDLRFLKRILVGIPILSYKNLYSSDGRHFGKGKLRYVKQTNYCLE